MSLTTKILVLAGVLYVLSEAIKLYHDKVNTKNQVINKIYPWASYYVSYYEGMSNMSGSEKMTHTVAQLNAMLARYGIRVDDVLADHVRATAEKAVNDLHAQQAQTASEVSTTDQEPVEEEIPDVLPALTDDEVKEQEIENQGDAGISDEQVAQQTNSATLATPTEQAAK